MVGRLSTEDNVASLHALYGEHDEREDSTVMYRLSQELGSSETLEETSSGKRRSSVEGRGSASTKIDAAGQTDREKAIMRSAIASQKMNFGKKRVSLSTRGSILGGRGAALRKPSQKYIPPSSPSLPSKTESDINEQL